MPIQQITPSEAKQILDKDPEAVYVDVRSIPEFVNGHPARAINIPILHKSGNGLVPNSDFQKVAEKVLHKNQTLVVGCLSGGRSQKACQMLQQWGYTKLHNMMGGFGGGMNSSTGEAVSGWKDSGLPISQENGEGVGYESLK